MEKLTADLGNQFATEGAITGTDVTTLEGEPPSMTGISYMNASNGSTYQILCGSPLANCTNPTAATTTAQVLPPSPYSGMNATVTPLTLSVTASEMGGGEVKLERNVQLVGIPVFQFGVYSDSDLSFFNGPSFDFGGRTHTNGNLWLSPNSGPLFLGDKVTVVGQVIRTNLENGYPGAGTTIGAGGDYSGIVSIALTPNPSSLPTGPSYSNTQWRPLALTESSVTGSSVTGAVSTTANDPTWPNVESAYNGMLVNGVSPLSLTSTALGGLTQPISLIRRPLPGEAASNPSLFSERYFSQATVRILLDDYATPGSPSSGCAGSDMMNLNGIDTTTNPTDLTTLADIAKSGAGGAAYNAADGYWIANSQATISGCLKIEYQDTGGAFHDITSAILALGYRGANLNPQSKAQLAAVSSGTQLLPLPTFKTTAIDSATMGANYLAPSPCLNPDAGAIIRIERLRDNPSSEYPTTGDSNNAANNCGTAGATNSDYWPNVLYDTREGLMRGVQTNSTDIPQDASNNPLLTAMGVVNYIEVDVGNLATWLKNNQTPKSLNDNTGYTVYFSDRRGEQIDPTAGYGYRTGSFGYDDIVNGASDPLHGCPNSLLDTGEDLEGDGVLRNYGGVETTLPNLIQSGLLNSGTNTVMEPNPTFCNSLGNTWPGAVYVQMQDARENPPAFFRRAVKLVDGETINAGTACFTGGAPACGLTIAAENPVYIQGDYNVPGLSLTSASSVATSVAADAITLLSDGWNDVNSFISPYTSDARPGRTTSYRVALIGGKGLPFPQPTGTPEDFGTDGGLHNFLRYLENLSPSASWGFPASTPTGGQTINYVGSLVSFYYNRQGIGEYKGDVDTVYTPPTRAYSFDTNFTLGTQFLPPKTPVLRSINTTGFTQEINPTQ